MPRRVVGGGTLGGIRKITAPFTWLASARNTIAQLFTVCHQKSSVLPVSGHAGKHIIVIVSHCRFASNGRLRGRVRNRSGLGRSMHRLAISSVCLWCRNSIGPLHYTKRWRSRDSVVVDIAEANCGLPAEANRKTTHLDCVFDEIREAEGIEEPKNERGATVSLNPNH